MALPDLLEAVKLAYYEEEQLRLEHNKKGAEFNKGVISWAEWRSFKGAWLKEHYACCVNLVMNRSKLYDHEVYELQPITDTTIKYPLPTVSDKEKYHYSLLHVKRFFGEPESWGSALLATALGEVNKFKAKFRGGV